MPRIFLRWRVLAESRRLKKEGAAAVVLSRELERILTGQELPEEPIFRPIPPREMTSVLREVLAGQKKAPVRKRGRIYDREGRGVTFAMVCGVSQRVKWPCLVTENLLLGEKLADELAEEYGAELELRQERTGGFREDLVVDVDRGRILLDGKVAADGALWKTDLETYGVDGNRLLQQYPEYEAGLVFQKGVILEKAVDKLAEIDYNK